MKKEHEVFAKAISERLCKPSRRTLLKAALASASVPTLASALTAGSFVRNKLHVPPLLLAQDAVLGCAPAYANLGGGQMSNVLGYTGQFPGPTLVARQGDVASLLLVNGLSQETITHWHGMLVDEANDGGPHMAIPPGASYQYSFPVTNRACLNFYHPHPHGHTGEQVALGLAGAFIVRDAEEDTLGLPGSMIWTTPRGTPPRARSPLRVTSYEVPLILRDANFDSLGNLRYNPGGGGFFGSTPLVNGTLDPMLEVDTAVYRFRIVNASNARVMRLVLSNGDPFWLIGNDGGLLEFPAQVGTFEIGPGERLDVLVDFRGKPLGTSIMLRELDTNWDFIEFVVKTQRTEGRIPSGRMSTIAPLTNPVRTRTFVFEGMNRINGLTFDPNRIDFEVPFGDVERWIFQAGGTAPHPIHVHGASFQVKSRSGGRGQLFPWEAGWKDTVLLKDGETAEVFIKFDRLPHYVGPQRYVLHCHKLEHEDAGMMSMFRAV